MLRELPEEMIDDSIPNLLKVRFNPSEFLVSLPMRKLILIYIHIFSSYARSSLLDCENRFQQLRLGRIMYGFFWDNQNS